MEVTIEKVSKALAKVHLTVPKEEFAKEFQSGLRQVGRGMRVKGFRPGKVPASVVAQKHGEQVRHEVKENFLRRAYQQAVKDEGLKPLTHPRIELEALVGDESQDLQCEFEISLRPEAELPQVKGISIESQLEPVLDETIDSTIEDIKRQQSTPEPAGDEGIDENGLAVCDVAFLRGEEVAMERDGLRLGPTTTPPGVDPEAFKEAMTGAKEGDVLELEATLDAPAEGEEPEKGTCRVTIKEAFRMVPPPDEKLLEMLEAESVEEMRTKVRERLEEAMQQREEQRVESALLAQVIDNTPLELPEPMVEEQTEARLAQLRERLAGEGLDEEKIQQQLEEQRATAREEAERGIKALLVVEAIGEANELLVDKEDMEEELASIAERNKATVEEVKEYYAQNNLGQQVAIELLERKVRRFLRENASIQEPS